MDLLEIEREARRMNRHKVVFTDPLDRLVTLRALQGLSTRAISEETGMPIWQVEYRIVKAQRSLDTRFRRDYRNGSGPLVRRMLRATEAFGLRIVDRKIAPKFIPLAAPGQRGRMG